MVKPSSFPRNAETIETRRKVTKFIYNHAYVLNWVKRDFTNGRDLIRPAITRFATILLACNVFISSKMNLDKMWTSTAWVQSSYSATAIGMDISEILWSSQFWRNI